MKKIISIFAAIAIVVVSVIAVNANNIETIMSVNDVEQYGFNEEVTEMLKNKILSGSKIYYGEGTTEPSYLNENTKTRSIPTDIVELPAYGATINYDMTYGNVYYSPYLFRATRACAMKIYRTSSISHEACRINLQVVDKTTNSVVFNNNLQVSESGAAFSVQLTASHEYYLITTPLSSGSSHVGYVITGE